MTKKSEWNLLKSVENRIDQIQLLRPYTTPWNEGVSDLCAEIEAKLKCPHITGNPEGGQWCQLAESSVTKLQVELDSTKAAIEFFKNTFSFLERSNGIFGVDPHMTVDLILSRIADQSQQIKDLENEIAKLKEHLKMTEDTLKWAYYVLGKTLPYLRESNPEAVSHIERALIGLDFTGMEEIASQAKDDSLGEKSGNTPQL